VLAAGASPVKSKLASPASTVFRLTCRLILLQTALWLGFNHNGFLYFAEFEEGNFVGRRYYTGDFFYLVHVILPNKKLTSHSGYLLKYSVFEKLFHDYFPCPTLNFNRNITQN